MLGEGQEGRASSATASRCPAEVRNHVPSSQSIQAEVEYQCRHDDAQAKRDHRRDEQRDTEGKVMFVFG